MVQVFKLSRPSPDGILIWAKPHLLKLSKQCHKLETKCSSALDLGGIYNFDHYIAYLLIYIPIIHPSVHAPPHYLAINPSSTHSLFFSFLLSFIPPLLKYLLCFMCTSVLPECLSVCVPHTWLVLMEFRGGGEHQIPWNWNYECLWATTLVLGTKPCSSASTTSVGHLSSSLTLLIHQSTSPSIHLLSSVCTINTSRLCNFLSTRVFSFCPSLHPSSTQG